MDLGALIGDYPGLTVVLVGVVGFLLRSVYDHVQKQAAQAARANQRQDVTFAASTAAYDERFKRLEDRIQSHSERINQVEAHSTQISDMRVVLGELGQRLVSVESVMKELATTIRELIVTERRKG